MGEEFNQRRRGKIAQCPRHIREQICRLLDDGKSGREVIDWVNAQAEVQALLAEKFAGEPISDNNLSQWFKGGFQDWREAQAKVEETTAKMELSLKLAQAAGGSMSEGALAVAAGRIMTELEGAEGKQLIALARGAAALRGQELDKEKVEIARERTVQRGEIIKLDREKFERLVVGKFIDWAANEEARAIATGSDRKEVKMDKLITLMFGPRPEPAPTP
jgi:hypothetical protein